jgi:stage V sporulation protein SpoVS
MNYQQFCNIVNEASHITSVNTVDIEGGIPAQFENGANQKVDMGDGTYTMVIDGERRSRRRMKEGYQELLTSNPDSILGTLPNLLLRSSIPELDKTPVNTLGLGHVNAAVKASTIDGKLFVESEIGKALQIPRGVNGYPLFQTSLMALLNGYWDSFVTGTKERTLITSDVRARVRLGDPRHFVNKDVFELSSATKFTLDRSTGVATYTGLSTEKKPKESKKSKVVEGKKPSEVGFGGGLSSGNDVPKTIHVIDGVGVRRFSFALQELKRIPFKGPKGENFNLVCHRAMAALALLNAIYSWAYNTQLRYGCDVLERPGRVWEARLPDGDSQTFTLTLKEAKSIATQAFTEAREAGASWNGRIDLHLPQGFEQAVLDSRRHRETGEES